MRSTINLDDTIMEKARFLTGTKETAALVRQALETLVRVESGKCLVALGGTMPDAEAAPRRRSSGQVILADNSIWIDHFRRVDAELRRIIEDDLLLCHPAVIGELALGSLRDRGSVITFLAAQRVAVVATHDEVMTMIDRHSLFSIGIGYTDAHLLASVLIDQRATLWTRDKRLRAAAEKAGASLQLTANRPN